MVLDNLIGDRSCRDLAGPANQFRDTESTFPVSIFLTAEWSHGAIWPCVHVRTVVRAVNDQSVVCNAEFVQQVQQFTHVLIMIDHCVVIWRLPTAGLSETLRLGMCPQVHVSKIHPAEKWRLFFGLFCNPLFRGCCELVIAGFHALLCKRARILNLLLSYTAPAWLNGRVVFICRKAMQHATWSEILAKVREVLGTGIIRQFRLFFGVEVIQIAEKFIEPVRGR